MELNKTHIDLYEMSAEEIYQWFLEANLPCIDLIVYDEETDVNHQLGRPGCYTSKVNFDDERMYKNDNKPREKQKLTIEVFENTQDAVKRKTYVESIIEKVAIVTKQYIYLKGNALIRLPFDLIPKYAKEYEAVLDDLLAGIDPTNKFEKIAVDNALNAQASTYDFSKLIFNDKQTVGNLVYFTPQNWLFKGNNKDNYHYAKEIGSAEGGYIYAKYSSLDKNYFKDEKQAYNLLESAADGMFSNPKITLQSEKIRTKIDSNPALTFNTNFDNNGQLLYCGNIFIGIEKELYSFSLMFTDQEKNTYQKFIDSFILSIENNQVIDSIDSKLDLLKSKLGMFKK